MVVVLLFFNQYYKIAGILYIFIYFLKCFNDYSMKNDKIYKKNVLMFDKLYNIILCVTTIFMLTSVWNNHMWILYIFIIFQLIDCYLDTFINIENNIFKNKYDNEILSTINLFFGGTNYLILFIILLFHRYFI